MKKIIFNFILFIFISIIFLILILSTIGIETNKFNRLISSKILQTKNIKLDLDTIKFKINPQKISLFLETQNPKISYRNVLVPARNIKVYIDVFSLLKQDPKIKQINLSLKELDITQLNKLSMLIKPSNFKSLLNNKIKEGRLISEIEIFLNEKDLLKNYIVKGSVKDLKIQLINDFNLTKTNLNFFADKNDILIKNIFGEIAEIKILDGDIKLNLEEGVKLSSNFNSKINLNEKNFKNYVKLLKKYKLDGKIKSLDAELNNSLSIHLDKTYKIKNYNYSILGNVKKSKFVLSQPIINNFIIEEIKEIYFSDLKIKTIFSPKNINFFGDGKYSFNNSDFLKINFKNNFNNNLMNLKLDLNYKNSFVLDFINYKKKDDSLSNILLDLDKKVDVYKINSLNFKEGKNIIKITDLIFKQKKILSFKKIQVETKKNNFSIQNNKKIIMKGNKFDATNLPKFLNNMGNEDNFEKLNGQIEVNFKNIYAPMSEKLQNFKLLGEIKKGQFIKIFSKGDFGSDNYLDISMKKDKNTDKKYLEIYSDLTRPLLTEYSFFKGLTGGKLLFTSIIDGNKSNSKLKIEDFKLVNTPGVIKLLSLADLGGLADLAAGEGLSFDILEINMEKNKDILKLNEILALGPSMSVLMEGYQDANSLTSLRGTLVPAKTLNKMISKIPIIGNIVIPKEVGEGLFGISFKMKGTKGKIKTTINPLKTLTPRFIQKIIDRNKITK